MKRSSIEPWIENVGETGCLEPAFKQNTNDDDDIKSFSIKILFNLLIILSKYNKLIMLTL